jgi:chromosome segregation protein
VKILRLELFGFKSFKDKTIVAFNQPITAIVGSNGCGKSNVIDALYWVMGDMSAKHLRGTHMSDVIFSGSKDTKALDMAEVTLVLERDPDKDPELPPQFQVSNEIQITRRYYRSGETEYFINKIPCRLRDIQEFFMDTGVGVKAYAIIEQGAIARLVTQKPEERRSIIEEVAGIMKFKARKAETERKVANSKSNLQRIDDILKDLRKNLSNLKAQATKAERFRTLSDELRSLEIRLASQEWLERMGDKTQALLSSAEYEERHARAQEELESIQSTILKAEERLHVLEDELNQGRARTREAELSLKDLEARVGTLNTRKDGLREQTEANEGTLQNLEERRGQLDEEILTLETQLALLHERAQILSTESGQAEQAAAEIRSHAEVLRQQVSAARQNLHKAEIEQTRLTQEIQNLQKNMAQLSSRKDSLGAQLGNIADEILAKEAEKASTMGQLEQAFSTRSDLESAKHTLDQELHHLENRRNDLQAARDSIREELTVVRVRKEQMEALDRNLEGIDASSKTLALHLREKGLEESLLLDAVKVPSLFEKAVEAAFGHNLQRVVAGSFVDLEDLRSVLAHSSTHEAKSSRSRYWIPGLSVQHAAASRNSGPSMDKSYINLGGSDLPPEDAFVPASFSEVPGPDGLISYQVEATPEQDLAKVTTVREWLLEQPEVIGPMREILVSADVDANAPWLALLENFWVVRSREAFSKIVQTLDGLPIGLVSLDGDVLSPEGFVDLAPVEATEGQSNYGLVQRKREIKELRAREQEIEHSLQTAQQFFDDCLRSYQDAKNTFRDLTAKLAALNPDVEKLSTLLRRDEAYLARLLEKRELLTQDLIRIESDVQEISAKLEDLVVRLQSLDEQKEQAAMAVEDVQLQLQGRIDEQKAAEALLASVQQQYRNVDRELAQGQTRKAGLERELQVSSARAEELIARTQEIDTELRAIVDEIEIKLGEIQEQDKVFQDAHKVQEELAESVRTERASLREVQSRQEELNRDVQKLVSNLKDLQQRLAIQDVEMKNLSAQIRTQYQLFLDSMSEQELRDLSQPGDLEEMADPEAGKRRLEGLRKKIDNLGKINMVAVEEFEELSKRYEFLFIQRQDVFEGIQQLEAAIAKIDRESRERFAEAFMAVNESFQKTFPVLFGGGNAELRLTDPDNLLETGVEIVAQPPGKKLQSVTLLSGGEKALTAVALIFGIFAIKPSPFCVLDEVDAPLDDANVGRFNQQIRGMSETSQIIMITHRKQTMERADALFGVTMEQPGISKVSSVELGGLKRTDS